MKKTLLASAISLAMMSSSVWAVPCNYLAPLGSQIQDDTNGDGVNETVTVTTISPYDQEDGVVCSTTTVSGEFIFDKQSIKGGETVNLAILGLNREGEVDRFGEDGGSILMAVVSTKQGLIPLVNPEQGSPNSGQIPEDTIGEGSFVNRQDRPTENPDLYRTTRIVQLENGNGEINIYYPPNVNTNLGGSITVKLQERESTPGGGIRVNTIKEVTKPITIAPPPSDPGALDIVSFMVGFNDGSAKGDNDSSNGIHGQISAGRTGAGSAIELQARNERTSGEVKLILTPIDGGESLEASGLMINGYAKIDLPAEINSENASTAGDYYLKASIEVLNEAGDVVKTVTSVDLDTVDKVTVLPTGTPRALKLSFNKDRISQLGQGAVVAVDYLDEYGNETTNRAGTSYTVSISEASNNAVSLTTTLDALGNHDIIVLGDAAGEISIASGTLSFTASASGVSPSATASLAVINRVLNLTVLPGFAPGTEIVANNQVEALNISENVGVVFIENLDTGEVSDALRDPTTGNVRAAFRTIGKGPYLVSDSGNEYPQVIVDGSLIVPAKPDELKLYNAHNEEVDSVISTLLPDNSRLFTDIPEKAIRLFDEYSNPVTGEPAGKFILESPIGGSSITYPQGSGSATPTGMDRVVVDYPVSAAGTGDIVLAVKLTAPRFTEATEVNTTLPEIITFDSMKVDVEKTTIPVNSRVALSLELLDQNGDLVLGDNAVRLVVNKPPIEDETSVIKSPVIREVLAGDGVNPPGGRSGILSMNQGLLVDDGKKIFEVNAGQVPGTFTVHFEDPSNTADPVSLTFTVTQVLEEDVVPDCSSDTLDGCETEETCNAVGGGYTGTECTAVPALGTLAIDNAGAFIDPVPAGANVKGGYSVNGNPFANPASATDVGARIKIVGSIEAADADVGAEADIIAMYAGVELGGDLATAPIFILVNEATEIAQWDGTIENIPAFSTTTLEEYNVVNIFDTGEGGFNIEGELYVLVAYRTANGNIVFGENLLVLEIDDPRN